MTATHHDQTQRLPEARNEQTGTVSVEMPNTPVPLDETAVAEKPDEPRDLSTTDAGEVKPHNSVLKVGTAIKRLNPFHRNGGSAKKESFVK